MLELPFAENFRVKMIEPIKRSTKEERMQWIKEADYNLFNLKSDQVYVDLLTDSGTCAMSDRQWAGIMQGDESYAGSRSYYNMKNMIKKIFNYDHFLPTHQGRAAENVLFSVLVKEGDIVPGNSHFDTTKGHIEFRKGTCVDCTIDEAFDTELEYPFKGNIDLQKLEKVLKEHPKEKIPCIIVTVTCNTSGGQPVSIDNIRKVKQMAEQYGIPVCFDSARFAQNAYFIKQREEEFKNSSIKEIVLEMYKYADMMTMSSKKDAIVNIGGFIAMKDQELFKQSTVYNILFEGYITYGGMSGRDMDALAVGLDEATDYDNLHTRIQQVAYLAKKLDAFNIPFQRPVGGHAVFIDAKKFLPHIKKEEFQAQTLALELYIEGGIRGVEIGSILADRDPVTKENRFGMEYLRLAIPWRTYTNNHMDVVAVALNNVMVRRNEIKRGVRIVEEAPIIRHFTVKLEKIKDDEEEEPQVC